MTQAANPLEERAAFAAVPYQVQNALASGLSEIDRLRRQQGRLEAQVEVLQETLRQMAQGSRPAGENANFACGENAGRFIKDTLEAIDQALKETEQAEARQRKASVDLRTPEETEQAAGRTLARMRQPLPEGATEQAAKGYRHERDLMHQRSPEGKLEEAQRLATGAARKHAPPTEAEVSKILDTPVPDGRTPQEQAEWQEGCERFVAGLVPSVDWPVTIVRGWSAERDYRTLAAMPGQHPDDQPVNAAPGPFAAHGMPVPVSRDGMSPEEKLEWSYGRRTFNSGQELPEGAHPAAVEGYIFARNAAKQAQEDQA